MGRDSGIQWTHHTFNPWIGCAHVSPGCENCYAETLMDQRYKRAKWGPSGTRVRTTPGYWREPLTWAREAAAAGERHRVFCASLADVFERNDLILHDWRAELWALIERTPELDWMLLTKRPENVEALVPTRWLERWPAWAWLGVSVEDQRRANERIPILNGSPAEIRFLSCEPLLGPVSIDLREVWAGIDLVIIGGESGDGARPMRASWAQGLRDQALRANVPVHFKQWGEWVPAEHAPSTLVGREVDGKIHLLRDGKPLAVAWPWGQHAEPVFRAGKKDAGRHLDGLELNGMAFTPPSLLPARLLEGRS
jgi:protein gp37